LYVSILENAQSTLHYIDGVLWPFNLFMSKFKCWHIFSCYVQKLDPTQFLRVYGRPVKVNLDPAVAIAAESPQSMWVSKCSLYSKKCIGRGPNSSKFSVGLTSNPSPNTNTRTQFFLQQNTNNFSLTCIL
jgi:hypothetical protein